MMDINVSLTSLRGQYLVTRENFRMAATHTKYLYKLQLLEFRDKCLKILIQGMMDRKINKNMFVTSILKQILTNFTKELFPDLQLK